MMMSDATVQKYNFRMKKDGYTEYSGVMDNGKEIDYVEVKKTSEKDEDRECTVYYADGSYFKLKAHHSCPEDGVEKLDNIKKEWHPIE